MKTRITDEARRAAGTIPDDLAILSVADNPAMRPLNTEEGRDYIDAVIARFRPEFIIFDNIQALILGDMKEEDGWASVLPWIKSITGKRIGQEWIHHTGHDEGRGYGTKTREWPMDTVAIMKGVDRPEALISFELSFTKHRDKRPDNQTDYATVQIALVADKWTSDPVAAGFRGGGNAKNTRHQNAVRILAEHLNDNATTSMSLAEFDVLMIDRGVMEAETNKGRFTDLRQRLMKSGHIKIEKRRVCLTGKRFFE
jgi:hypothetical protein